MRQITLFMSYLGLTSTRMGALKCLVQGHTREKSRGSSAARPLDYESNTEPRSHGKKKNHGQTVPPKGLEA